VTFGAIMGRQTFRTPNSICGRLLRPKPEFDGKSIFRTADPGLEHVVGRSWGVAAIRGETLRNRHGFDRCPARMFHVKRRRGRSAQSLEPLDCRLSEQRAFRWMPTRLG